MAKIFIVIFVSLIICLMISIFKTWRQKRKDRELSYLNSVHVSSDKQQKRICDSDSILASTMIDLEGMKQFVGKLEEMKRAPREGDMAYKGEDMYLHHDGRWKHVVIDLPKYFSINS